MFLEVDFTTGIQLMILIATLIGIGLVYYGACSIDSDTKGEDFWGGGI